MRSEFDTEREWLDDLSEEEKRRIVERDIAGSPAAPEDGTEPDPEAVWPRTGGRAS